MSWSSTFYIRQVSEQDYGYYECVAENGLGASTFPVHFTPPTAPDPPLALKVGHTGLAEGQWDKRENLIKYETQVIFNHYNPAPTPASPLLFLLRQVVNSSHDSVWLAWQAGFDGGKTQYFRLRYRSQGSTAYHYHDVAEPGVQDYQVGVWVRTWVG